MYLKVFIITLVVLVAVNNVAKARQLGGLSGVKQATAETQRLVDLVRSDAEEKASQKFGKFKAKQFKFQIVAGTNYFVKVDVGDGQYVHLRVYQPLPFNNPPPRLDGIKLNKSADDEIKYF